MSAEFEGQRVFITGATRGIGLAVARAFAAEGAQVVAGCRRPEDVTVGEPFACELHDPALPPGPLHHFVHNAGVWLPDERGDEAWTETWQLHVRAGATLSHAFVTQAERGAAIVHITSRASHRGEAGYAAYASSKAAQNALAKSLASEFGPRGIRVNAVAPGWVRTDMTRDALPAEGLPEPIPLGRVAVPEDVAGPVLFLCSERARFVTGIVLDVNGGAYLH
ncbi:MAG: SDR family oxidoreductase [Planctomycetota bacterium]